MNGALALEPPPARFGAAMARRFGALYHLLGLGRALGRTRLEDPGVEIIREAASRGPVVYVLPRCSTLDHLALNAALAARHLPLSVWAPRMGTTPWLPLSEAWAALRLRFGERFAGRWAPDPVATGWIVRALAAGEAITWFVDDRARWFTRDPMPFDGLVGAAALTPAVQIVPLMVVWDRSPETADPIRRFFLGKQGVPGLLWRIWHALRSADGFIHVGRPIDLVALRERVGEDRLAGVLRRVVARALRDERRLVHGPRLLPHRTMKNLVLRNPAMRDLARREAGLAGVRVEKIERKISSEYDRIAANFSWTMIQVLHLALRPLWTRVFNGVDAPPADMERIRSSMREGAIVLAPCHKSHVDYLLMSWVMYDHDLVLPHVVAGMNLAVWPISVVLRGAGGFFLKRSLKGDRIFPEIFSRYLRELLRQEYPVEFFIEGGRTRTGRLMVPKIGVLSMILDAAALRTHGRQVTVLPIALAYEQVAEEKAYAREQGGEQKRPESFGELLRARSVMRRRFGRVYLRVGEPIRCGELVDPGPDCLVPWADRPDADRRQVALDLGHRIMGAIGQRMVLLPTTLVAMALLALPIRAVRHTELMDRIRRFDALLRAVEVDRAESLQRFDQAVAQALDVFVRDGRITPLEVGGERVWGIEPEGRITLEFYKNSLLHRLAAGGLAAAALRPFDGPVDVERLEGPFERIAHLLRRELVRDGTDLPAGLALLEQHGAVRREAGTVTVLDPVRIGELYGLVRPLLEGYHAAIDGWALPATRDARVHQVQELLPELVAAGKVTRPESLSVVTLQGAISTAREDGVVAVVGTERTWRGGAEEELAALPNAASALLGWLGPMVLDRGDGADAETRVREGR